MSTYQTPIPGAPGYGQANLLARRAYENAMSRFAQRRAQRLLHYGYTRDAQGNLSVDPNNEYGQYQQMLRGQDVSSRRLDRYQRASGWGEGSGYLGAAREDLQREQGGQGAALGQALAGELADISQGEQGAEYERDRALYQNELEAARDAINQGNFNPANYGDLDVPYGEQEPAPRPRPRPRPTVHQRGRARLVQSAARRVRGRRR